MAAQPGKTYRPAGIVLTWFTLLLFMATAFLLFTSVFWAEPLDLKRFVTPPPAKQAEQVPPMPENSSKKDIVQPGARSGDGPMPGSGSRRTDSHETTIKFNTQADKWEHRGDIAALSAINQEIQLKENYEPIWDTRQSPSTPFQKLNQTWGEAKFDWTQALKASSDAVRIKRLRDKMDNNRRMTCEEPTASPDSINCYANGTDSDVSEMQGNRRTVQMKESK